MSAEAGTFNALPKLPGFDFGALNQPPSYNKAQAFGWGGGVRTVKEVVPAGAPPGSAAMIGSKRPQDVPAVERDLGISREAILCEHPQWKSLMDKALRFFGYFTERVEESVLEKVRVRKVCVTFHMHDATVSVSETPAVGNSGLRAGTLMSRHYDPSLNLFSFNVGSAIKLRGREMVIVDCDAATRQFYNKMSLPQAAARDYPSDAFETRQLAPRASNDPELAQIKRTNESLAAAATGKVATFMSPEERIKAKNFLEHDREVLVFFAVWDNRRFRINYFIADDTISVTNVHAVNCGRDTNAAFIKRGVIPKGKNAHKAIDTITAKPTENYTAADLYVGLTMNVFGRDFYIYACDPFTKQFYAEKFGVELVDAEKPQSEGDPVLKRPQLDKEKRKKGTYGRYLKHANDVLRFAAELSNPNPEDAGRQFIICYYVADDTVTVFEFTVRNSGHNGGKVFNRAKVPGVDANSLQVGSTIVLGGFKYFLKEMDERTQRHLETGNPMDQMYETAHALLLKVRYAITVKYSRITEAYRHFNTNKSGIGLDELANLFRECEVRVQDEDTLMAVMDLVDKDRDGVISLQEFVEHLLDQALVHSHHPQPQGDEPVRSFTALKEEQAKREEGDRVLKLFIAKLEARRAYIVDTFRIVSDRAVDGLIGTDAFRDAVQNRLALNLRPSELDALVYRFFYIPGLKNYEARRLNLREFRRIVEA